MPPALFDGMRMKLKNLPLFPLLPIAPILFAGGLVALEAFILRRLGKIARSIDKLQPPPLLPA
jgi:hypothetical protein